MNRPSGSTKAPESFVLWRGRAESVRLPTTNLCLKFSKNLSETSVETTNCFSESQKEHLRYFEAELKSRRDQGEHELSTAAGQINNTELRNPQKNAVEMSDNKIGSNASVSRSRIKTGVGGENEGTTKINSTKSVHFSKNSDNYNSTALVTFKQCETNEARPKIIDDLRSAPSVKNVCELCKTVIRNIGEGINTQSRNDIPNTKTNSDITICINIKSTDQGMSIEIPTKRFRIHEPNLDEIAKFNEKYIDLQDRTSKEIENGTATGQADTLSDNPPPKREMERMACVLKSIQNREQNHVGETDSDIMIPIHRHSDFNSRFMNDNSDTCIPFSRIVGYRKNFPIIYTGIVKHDCCDMKKDSVDATNIKSVPPKKRIQRKTKTCCGKNSRSIGNNQEPSSSKTNVRVSKSREFRNNDSAGKRSNEFVRITHVHAEQKKNGSKSDGSKNTSGQNVRVQVSSASVVSDTKGSVGKKQEEKGSELDKTKADKKGFFERICCGCCRKKKDRKMKEPESHRNAVQKDGSKGDGRKNSSSQNVGVPVSSVSVVSDTKGSVRKKQEEKGSKLDKTKSDKKGFCERICCGCCRKKKATAKEKTVINQKSKSDLKSGTDSRSGSTSKMIGSKTTRTDTSTSPEGRQRSKSRTQDSRLGIGFASECRRVETNRFYGCESNSNSREEPSRFPTCCCNVSRLCAPSNCGRSLVPICSVPRQRLICSRPCNVSYLMGCQSPAPKSSFTSQYPCCGRMTHF